MAVQVPSLLLWLRWAVWRKDLSEHHPGRWTVLRFTALMQACFLFEVYDFAPRWNLLDAHATWHLATVPVVQIFWMAVEQDIVQLGKELEVRGRGAPMWQGRRWHAGLPGAEAGEEGEALVRFGAGGGHRDVTTI